jgi:hypothetical protein
LPENVSDIRVVITNNRLDKPVTSPLIIVLVLIDFISWIIDIGDPTEQVGSRESRDNSASPNKSKPQQRLETVQRSVPTAEDINAHRPDESKETCETGNSSPFEN